MLKETDLRVNFTDLFQSATVHENLPRAVLQRRLLYCLYAFGSNTGLSRVATGDDTVNYRDLLYVRRRFINKDSLRAAIQLVAKSSCAFGTPRGGGVKRRPVPPMPRSLALGSEFADRALRAPAYSLSRPRHYGVLACGEKSALYLLPGEAVFFFRGGGDD
jgi:hypothetical protein